MKEKIPYECSSCNKRLAAATSCKDSWRKTINSQTWKMWKKNCGTKGELSLHFLIHSYMRKDSMWCLRCIFSKSLINKHKCHIFDPEFSISGHLKSHILSVHENKMPFQWSICEQKFASKIHTILQFMKEKDHSDVKFVMPCFHQKEA